MKKFDAVVIGSGTGGLSAALSLAIAGKKILLLEQHNLPPADVQRVLSGVVLNSMPPFMNSVPWVIPAIGG